jgi:hypothetical protein
MTLHGQAQHDRTCVLGAAYRSGSPARLSSTQIDAYDRGRPSYNAHAVDGQPLPLTPTEGG